MDSNVGRRIEACWQLDNSGVGAVAVADEPEVAAK